MSIEERNSFQLYHNFYNQFKLLGMEERGELITAIFEYAKDQTMVRELSPLVNMAFSCMKDTLDRDREKYERICEKNAENGKKGGRPRKADTDIFSEKTERFFEESKKADKDKDRDKENDKDNDMDRDREKDREKDREIEEKPADISDICLEAPLPPENILTSHSVYAPPIVSALPSETAPQSSAPTLRDPEQTRREEKNILVLSGIPLEYINEREERAEEFARKQKRSFVSVFREWWEKDKAHYEWKRESTSPSVNGAFHSKEKSYDTDAFFEAALKKSYDEFDRRYGKEGS